MDCIQKQLNEIKNLLKKQNFQQKEIMSLEEAQLYLNVSKSFLYKLTSNNELTFFKPNGKLIFIRKVDLDQWMLQNKNKSIRESEIEMDNYLKR